MNDRVLVEALRACDPGAFAALYDSYAESVYRYCWAVLGNPDSAQVALRDTLIAAEAHAGSLADPDRLSVWLFALARGECARRRVPSGSDQAATEFSIAVPPLSDPTDADLRVVAWNAGRGLAPEDREVLELSARHGLAGADLAAVLGTGQRYAEALLEAATERLRDAVTAEILARKGPFDCPKRAKILAGFAGQLTPEMRDQVTRHLPGCVTCRPHRVRQISVAKVFGLLPEVVLPETLRVRVMSCFTDPELAPYRRYVAERVGALNATGFPVDGAGAGCRWQQAFAGALAAVASVAIVALAFNQLSDGPQDRIVGIASGAFPATGEPPGIQVPWTDSPEDMPMVLRPILDVSPAYPIGSRDSAKPIRPTTSDPDPTPGPRPSGIGPDGNPSPAPSTAPPTTPDPTETLPTQAPTEIPTGRPTGGPTGGHHHHRPPRDHHHHPRPHRDCPPTNGTTPASTAGSQTPAHTPAQAPADPPAAPSSPPPSPAAPVAAEAVAPARDTVTDPSSGSA